MTPPLLPLLNSATNPGPDGWLDAINNLINYLNTYFYYNPSSGGGSSAGTFRPVNGGATDTMQVSDYNGTIGWNSAVAAGKLEQIIPGPLNTPVRITLKDNAGTAGTYNISTQAIGGCTIEGGATHAGVNGDKGYITYEWDGTSNWMVVA